MPADLNLTDVSLIMNPRDNVAVARQAITAGKTLHAQAGTLAIRQAIPTGHKLALAAIARGEVILRYGAPIGVASQPIQAGDWVHTHNVTLPSQPRQMGFTLWEGDQPTGNLPELSFMGFRRADGQVGTRNLIAVISTVSCSAQTALAIAAHFTPQQLAEYPNVDGVVAVVHHTGCSITPDGLAYTYLQRCLTNLARHPNIGGVVFISLGCEVMQLEGCQEAGGDLPLRLAQQMAPCAPVLSIQELGGIDATLQAGIRAVEELLAKVNTARRSRQPVAGLKIALQCGGSDGWSGVTANPLLGMVVDELVSRGGTAVLSETPEIYGAEQLLLGRVKSEAAALKLIRQIRWWEEQARLLGFSLDNNPTPGNKAGGLTTIYEKSLGAVAKGGSRALSAVYDYAELLDAAGLVFMDSPGNDPVSITGQLAGGCNLVAFTTGRGSVFGSGLAPTVKIASNSALFTRMRGDMDFNAGALLEGQPIQAARDELLELILRSASGARTSSEWHGHRQAEFVPWQPGAVL